MTTAAADGDASLRETPRSRKKDATEHAIEAFCLIISHLQHECVNVQNSQPKIIHLLRLMDVVNVSPRGK